MAEHRLLPRPSSAVWRILQSPLITAVLFSSLVRAGQDMNFNLTVPYGTTNHGDSSLLCIPTQWYDVLLFLCGNFLAHALTVVPKPGEPWKDLLLRTVVALFFPNYGMRDGLDAIFRHAIIVKDPLQRAARASALCMVVRSPSWKPRDGDIIQGVNFSEEQLQEIHAHRILENEKTSFYKTETHELTEGKPRQVSLATTTTAFGGDTRDIPWDASSERRLSTISTLDTITPIPSKYELPELTYSGFYSGDPIEKGCLNKIPTKWEVNGSVTIGPEYQLVLVPQDAKVQPITPTVTLRPNETRYPATLSAHYTLAKAVIAIFQTLYSSITLYQTRGDQVSQYGYAAFGLTVAPYTVMSLVNLLGNLCTPDYSTVQLIGSPTLDEALCRGNKIDASIGRLADEPTDTTSWTGTFEATNTDVEAYVVHFTPDVFPSLSSSTSSSFAEPFTALIRIAKKPKPEKPFNRIDRPHSVPTTPEQQLFLSHPSLPRLPRRSPMAKRWIRALFIIIVMVAPVGINGIISHFQPGKSTFAQRLWTMSWLAVGSVGRLGSMYGPLKEHLHMEYDMEEEGFWNVATLALCMLVYGMPVFGGMAVVIQMLVQYGSCTRFD